MARFKKLDVPHQWKDEFTKYPHGYSIFESISKWVKQVNTLIANINQWNEYLGGFTSTFGEVPQQMVELRQEMTVLLESVNSDLTTIINEVNGLADTLLSHLTNYASYLNSELGEEHIIRTLPNGVKDEIDLDTGKLIKRVSDEVLLQSADFIAINTTNNDVVDIVFVSSSRFNKGSWPVDTLGVVSVNGRSQFVGSYSLMTTTDIGKYRVVANSIAFIVAKGTTLEQAREQLAGLTSTYQLAEPEIIGLPEVMSPNTREIVRLSEQVDKLMNML